MSYGTHEAHELPSLESTEPQALSEAGQRAMQGRELDRALADRSDYLSESAPLDMQDKALMTIDSKYLHPETQLALQRQGLSSQTIIGDYSGDKAEAYARTIFEREGIPNGSSGMENVKRVVPGTYDGKHGIDLIAATEDGKLIPIEVKKRSDARQAHLNGPVEASGLEPETRKAKDLYEQQLQMYHDREYGALRRDWADRWKPEVAEWHRDMEFDLNRAEFDSRGVPRLAVEQMDELWTKDRYLKLLRSDGGADRLRTAGVHPKYCRLDNFVDGNGNLKDSPLWEDVLVNRMTVIVSPTDHPTSKTLLDQAIFESKSNRVLKIDV